MVQEIKTINSMHVFICTNEREDRDSCSIAITKEDFKEIKIWAREQKLIPKVFITRTGCLGFCNPFGGTIAIYPQKKFFTHIKSKEEIKEIIITELEKLA